MSKTNSLTAEARLRTGSGLLKQMRREGYTPSVIYGAGTENSNVKVNTKAFTDLIASSASDNIIVTLDVEGSGKQLAFIQDVQEDAITRKPLHIDFLAVNADTTITAALPLVFKGEPIGVKNGGLLEQLVYNVEVSCLPGDLPEIITADVSALKIGQSLHIGDLQLPDGVTAEGNADVLICNVAKTRAALSAGGEEEAEEAAEGEGTEGEDAPAEEAAAE